MRRQMVFKLVGKFGEFSDGMVVGDMLSDLFPDLFLGVEIRRSRWEIEDFQVGMRGQKGLNGWALMPGRTVPEQQNGLGRIGTDELVEKEHRCCPIHDRRAHHDFSASEQIQGAIEMKMVAAWIHFDDGSLAFGCPHDAQRGLEVHRGFIACHDHGLRGVLCRVYKFFSSPSSKAMTFAPLRDLYCRAGRWRLNPQRASRVR